MKIDLVIIYKESSLGKYFFRSIAKYLNWISNVYIVISSAKKLPSWLDSTKITIVETAQLGLKNERLDIELFLHKIPELAENFIVTRSDLLVVGELTPNYFISSDTALLNIDMIPTKEEHHIFFWKQDLKNIYEKLVTTKKVGFRKEPEYTLIPCTKTLLNKFWNEYKEELNNPTINLNLAAPIFFGLKNNLVKEVANPAVGRFIYDTFWMGIFKYDMLHNFDRKIVLLQETNGLILEDQALKWFKEALDFRVGSSPCKFEK